MAGRKLKPSLIVIFIIAGLLVGIGIFYGFKFFNKQGNHSGRLIEAEDLNTSFQERVSDVNLKFSFLKNHEVVNRTDRAESACKYAKYRHSAQPPAFTSSKQQYANEIKLHCVDKTPDDKHLFTSKYDPYIMNEPACSQADYIDFRTAPRGYKSPKNKPKPPSVYLVIYVYNPSCPYLNKESINGRVSLPSSIQAVYDKKHRHLLKTKQSKFGKTFIYNQFATFCTNSCKEDTQTMALIAYNSNQFVLIYGLEQSELEVFLPTLSISN